MSAALHQVRADFYGFNGLNEVAPADKWGWAASAGIVLNLPWNPGDKFWIEGGVGQGASAYTGFSQTTAFNRFNGTSVAAGWVLDEVFARNPAFPTSGIQLSTSWDITAAIEHYRTPALRTSVFGSYTAWDPDSAGNAIMCKSPDSVVRTTADLAPMGTTALAGCDFGFAVWAVGTRTIWNPVKNLDVGIEVLYSKIDQNMNPGRILMNFADGAGCTSGLYTPANEDVWSGLLSVQRNFWP